MRKGSATVSLPDVPNPLVLTRAVIRQLLAIAVQVDADAIGDDEISDVSIGKLIGGLLTGDKVMRFSGAGVLLKSENFQKEQRRFVAPLTSNLSDVITVPAGADFTAADVGRTIVGEGINTTIAAILGPTQARLVATPVAPALNVVLYMAQRPAGAGWALYGDGTLEVNAGGIFRGKLELAGFSAAADGTVTIGVGDSKMKALPDGSFTWGSGGAIVGITPAGEFFAGGIDFASAILRISAAGNVVIRNTAQSNHSISIGAIDVTILEPTATPPGGYFDTAVNVYLLCQTQGVKIYYTVDGTTPTTASTLYAGAINLTADTTIKAIAVKLGEKSTVMSKAFSLGAGTVPNPVADPVGGDYSPAGGSLSVVLRDSLAGASIRYTTDGTTTPTELVGTLISPADGSTPPADMISLAAGTKVLKAIAFKSGKTNSAVITETYNITSGGGGAGGGGSTGGRGDVP